MGKLKKVGIGLGVVFGIFVALMISAVLWQNSLTPEEFEKWERDLLESNVRLGIENKILSEKYPIQQELLLEKLRLEQELEQELKKQKQNIDPNSPMALYLKAEEGDINAKKEFDKVAKEYFDSAEGNTSQFPSKASLVTEDHILNFITNYKGQDNSGNTLLEAVAVLLNVSYPNENILENPTTIVNFYTLIDFGKDLSGRYWTVHLEIDTYRESVNWVWLVDTGTSKIYGENVSSKGILDILDTFG